MKTIIRTTIFFSYVSWVMTKPNNCNLFKRNVSYRYLYMYKRTFTHLYLWNSFLTQITIYSFFRCRQTFQDALSSEYHFCNHYWKKTTIEICLQNFVGNAMHLISRVFEISLQHCSRAKWKSNIYLKQHLFLLF